MCRGGSADHSYEYAKRVQQKHSPQLNNCELTLGTVLAVETLHNRLPLGSWSGTIQPEEAVACHLTHLLQKVQSL